MNNKLMFSSNDQKWTTPQNLYNKLNSVFYFTLDPCCEEHTAKCDLFFTEEEDGILQSWGENVVFMNPPYTKKENKCSEFCNKKTCDKRGFHLDKDEVGQEGWIRKAYNESLSGAVVVCLIPSRTDTSVWHDTIFPFASAICFMKGRLKFGVVKDSAPFPSALVVFSKEEITEDQLRVFSELGRGYKR